MAEIHMGPTPPPDESFEPYRTHDESVMFELYKAIDGYLPELLPKSDDGGRLIPLYNFGKWDQFGYEGNPITVAIGADRLLVDLAKRICAAGGHPIDAAPGDEAAVRALTGKVLFLRACEEAQSRLVNDTRGFYATAMSKLTEAEQVALASNATKDVRAWAENARLRDELEVANATIARMRNWAERWKNLPHRRQSFALNTNEARALFGI